MRRFQLALAISLVLTTAICQQTDAQPGKSNGGRKATPSSGRSPAPAPLIVPAIPAAAPQQHTYHQYNVYPNYATPVSAAPVQSFASPYGTMPSVTYVNQYYIIPAYMPMVTPGLAYYVPPRFATGAVGTFPPIVPRYDTGPKEATIEVLMTRSDAVLLVDGEKTSTTGLRRFFTSPALEMGTYAYQITASWMREDQEIRMERTVEVSPGGHYFIDFNKIEPAGD